MVSKIEQYKRENPTIFAWEIREKLISECKWKKVHALNIKMLNEKDHWRGAETFKFYGDFLKTDTELFLKLIYFVNFLIVKIKIT